MNLQALQRDLVKEAVRASGIVGGALALYLALSSWNSATFEEHMALQSRFGQEQAEIALLRTKVESAGTVGKSYGDLVTDRAGAGFEIDNARVRDVLQELVERYRLNLEGKLEYSAQQAYAPAAFQNLTNKFIVRRDARFVFTAITDQHVYSFLEALRRELPGIIRFTKFSLRRTAEADPTVIATLASGNPAYLVSAEVTFDWYGMVSAEAQNQSQEGAL